MAAASRTSTAAPGSEGLRQEVARVRRRSLAVLLAGAVVAALAADIWYEIASFWIFRFFRVRTWFPLFFFVALAVFTAAVVRRTRTLPLSTLLDARFALKGRLAAAFHFGRLPGMSADLREAQARETLRAVDFDRLRASFRFRPWGGLAFLIVGVGCTGWLMHRYPDSFNPRNIAFRQGRVVFMAVKSLVREDPHEDADSTADAPRQGDSGHPVVALVPEKDSPKDVAPRGTSTGATPEERSPAGADKKPEADSDDQGKKPANPESSPDRTPPSAEQRREGKGTRLGPDGGGISGRLVSLEETAAVSQPTARPESGMALDAGDLRGPGSGPALPALPFFRLLGGTAAAGTLFDPETLNIVLEAYPPKYREHLESYLKALQDFQQKRAGS